jgi:hypothetical protein
MAIPYMIAIVLATVALHSSRNPIQLSSYMGRMHNLKDKDLLHVILRLKFVKVQSDGESIHGLMCVASLEIHFLTWIVLFKSAHWMISHVHRLERGK